MECCEITVRRVWEVTQGIGTASRRPKFEAEHFDINFKAFVYFVKLLVDTGSMTYQKYISKKYQLILYDSFIIRCVEVFLISQRKGEWTIPLKEAAGRLRNFLPSFFAALA